MDIEVEGKKIRAELEKFSLPVLKLKPIAEAAKNRWSSKFGGKPYWPKGMEYPESKSGQKLFLLAQINFADLPGLPGFPQSGVLQFFIADDDLYGLDFDLSTEEIVNSPDGYRVIYHADIEVSEDLIENDLPEASQKNPLPVCREYRLECTQDSEIPSPTDFRYEKYATDPFEYESELANYIYEKFIADGSKLGGYANFTQDDPRINGEHDNWILLFQMDSEFSDDIDIMWGDVGVGNFFIEKEALEQLDFSRVWYNWDCC
ncbi:YwqG family protein [Microbulbifer sp. ZKSA006]|uniref:YwqG family protein n=1 Tax=Microbulbifer sp. ZKSA006 TaxID=3243390 RepID=UPI00403A511E